MKSKITNILFPGRHHLLTTFQESYLKELVEKSATELIDWNGESFSVEVDIKNLIFAVTSANHQNTRRNPLPFYLRALAIQEFSNTLPLDTLIFGIDDVGWIDDFANYTITKINHDAAGLFSLSTENTIVVCSTPVGLNYEKLGYRVLGCEMPLRSGPTESKRPWDLVEAIAENTEWYENKDLLNAVHLSTLEVWKSYRLDQKIRALFLDPLIGQDGDLTESRDYNIYVRQMDEIAELKYTQTKEFIISGRVGDIGCAVASWIKLATLDPRFHESEFYGIEISRHLYSLCIQRKENGEFANPYVFFAQKNAVTGLCFERASMDTIHCSSLTHEIFSYGSMQDLEAFIQNRYQELRPGGVWINRDVVGPPDKDQTVYLELDPNDGRIQDWEKDFEEREALADYLKGLSTFTRFKRFARDFRNQEKDTIQYEIVEKKDKILLRLSLEHACEYITKKDYCDNWNSEMHERFCFWTFEDWKKALRNAGFHTDPRSGYRRNTWIEKNRYAGKVKLYDKHFEEMPYPISNMILVGIKR